MPRTDRIVVNTVERDVGLEPDRSLLFVLREELGITGPKYGCGEGACGACTVLLDGAAVRACVTSVSEAAGRSVTTVEGLVHDGALHPVQQAFVEEGALQCGFCTAGMVVQAAALLDESPDPSHAEIAAAMSGNVCRCCTYPRIERAVHRAAELTRTATGPTQTDREAVAAATVAPGEQLPAAATVDPGEQAPAATVAPGEQVAVGADGAMADPLPRPAQPWDMQDAAARDYFATLTGGLVVAFEPGRGTVGRPSDPRAWSTSAGAWVHVGEDGSVTAFTGKVDVGQDNRTALSLRVAEELRVPLSAVRLVMGDTDVCPFDEGTFGSRSMPDAGEHLRRAAAGARECLLDAAAQRWNTARDRCTAVDGRVRNAADGRSVSYGELVRGTRQVELASGREPLTPGIEERIVGHPARKTTARDVVTGARRYPSDLTRPGMLHGAILRPPSFGATLRSVDLSSARAIDGVTVVHEDGFVGVAAPDAFTARRVLGSIQADWAVEPQPSERGLEAHLRAHPRNDEGWGGAVHHETGDVDAALGDAPVRLSETYTTAYIAHVPLEPRTALAEWEGGRLTVWTGTQRPFAVRRQLADELGVPESDVRVIVPDTGAGFGGKHTGETAVEAARLARASGHPVRVRWSRQEEFTWGYFRPAAVIDVRSGATSEGTITGWEFTNLNSGAAGIICPYDVTNQRIRYQPAESPLRQGSYRALAATANHFARESHIDELAHRLGVDPLELRLRNLRDDRLAAVLRAVAERAGWADRPHDPGRGMGIAGGVEKDGRIATCVEVRVGSDRRLEIVRIVTAFDCGAIVNPDNMINQLEGATIQGLGGALFEAIHFENGTILNPRLSDYRVPRFPDVPPIDVVLLDRRDIPSAGGGETPIVAVAPAVANAIFAATGVRLRALPLVPDGTVPLAAQGARGMAAR